MQIPAVRLLSLSLTKEFSCKVLQGPQYRCSLLSGAGACSDMNTATDIEQVSVNRMSTEVSWPCCIAKFKSPSAMWVRFTCGHNAIPHEETSTESHANLFINPELKPKFWQPGLYNQR